jgi:predicted ABC-class ATPase
MIIPKGITLICGGGFHGKSTLLRSLAMGIYNKIQGDGRELCITTYDAVSIRAEDGRYVNHCNITAFMSCIGQGGGGGGKKKEEEQVKREDKGESSSISRRMAYPTQHLFSTQEASGSTSQASNVIEAIEFGATALLMDEDVCAANFMARDGRMRYI